MSTPNTSDLEDSSPIVDQASRVEASEVKPGVSVVNTGKPSKLRSGLILAVVALVLCTAVSIFCGSKSLSPDEVWTAISLGPSHDRAMLPADISVGSYGIVWDLRIPRTLLAAIVGASIAIAGALAQTWTKNPLADPGIIGINAGAGCAVAVGLTLGLAGSIALRAMWGLAGAFLAAAIVLWISRVSQEALTLVLVGVGVTFSLQGMMNLLTLYSSDTLDGLRRWSVGSTAGRGYEEVWLALAGLLVGAVLAAMAAHPLDLLAMGEETAQSLGSSPRRARWLAAMAVVVLAGSATASVGLVMFLGFAVPHMVRPWAGPTMVKMLVPVAMVGATVTLFADILGRFVLRPNELDMAIVLAIIGAPLMIAVVRTKAGRRVHG